MTSLAECYTGVVTDLDGVVYRGQSAVEYAVDALASFGGPVQYATNNASRLPTEVAGHLRDLGLDVDTDQVATSSQAGARVLAGRVRRGARVLAVGGQGVIAALLDEGFDVVGGSSSEVEGVMQGYGPDVSARDLADAAYAIAGGAVWVATNTDRTLPTDRGLAPGNGALVGAVREAVGRDPDEVAGKPHPPLYRLCLERLARPAREVLAIGDRLDTDIEGAHRAGLDSVLVLTGVSGVADVVAAPPEQVPTWVIPDLRFLGADLDQLRPLQQVIASARETTGSTQSQIDTVERMVGDLLHG